MQKQNELEQFKAIHDDKEAVINGHAYKITKTTHKQRLKVFSYLTKVKEFISAGDFSFLDTDEFEKVRSVIESVVTFEGSSLSKLPNHWEEHEEDFLMFTISMMGALSYPFMKGVVTS